MNPNSLKNLKPYEKGHKGGPGTVRLPAELRIARRENMQNLIQLIHLYVGMTEDQAKVRLNGPDSLQIEEMIQGQINKAKEGDSKAFQFIIEVMCGKIPESDETERPTDHLTPEQKLEYMKRAVSAMEAKLGVPSSGTD